MKTPPVEIEFINQDPPALKDILEKIRNPDIPPEDHLRFIEAVESAKKNNYEGCANSDEGIKARVWHACEPSKDIYYEAYIQYLGMAFYYDEISKADAAWYYYAQSRYYKGIFDSWDAVSLHFEIKDQKLAARVKGGKNKALLQTDLLREEFLRIIRESKPAGGWKNKTALVKVAAPILESFRDSLGEDRCLLRGDIYDTATRWLRKDPEIGNAYVENSTQPDDILSALSDNATDPNHHY